jgi:hypothetical protein
MVESITVSTLLLSALDRIDLQAVFDRDPYESRRRALPGMRLVKVLVVYQMIGTEKLRELSRTLTEHAGDVLQILLVIWYQGSPSPSLVSRSSPYEST